MALSQKRKVVLPAATITETCNADDPRATRRAIPASKDREALTYYIRPLVDRASVSGANYNLLPVVLDRYGVPWDIASVYILSRLSEVSAPNMTTFHGIADDLGAFKEFLDERKIDFEYFPQMKLNRPTYQYHGELKRKMHAREIAPATAKRRMGCVVAFYRWLIQERLIDPTNDPWQERRYLLSFKNSRGFEVTKRVASTDIKIVAPKTDDPLAGTIDDGGRLRPLPTHEQNWVMEALDACGNPEMTMMVVFMLLTGARIQTALTLRVRHFSQALPDSVRIHRLLVGPRTGIDTKNDKSMTLHIPRSLYDLLRTYVHSSRAIRRRERAPGGDSEDQYLFLTQHGAPYYQAKADSLRFDPNFNVHHRKRGQSVRQFLTDHLIPYIREHRAPDFHFQIHDLRASFGMNQTDIQLALVREGKITLRQARNVVQALMAHESSETTDLYLDYRSQMQMVYAAIDGYEAQVAQWIDSSMKGLLDD